MLDMLSATSMPLFVSFISLIRPFFSKVTNPSCSRVCRIFTAWLYVQSTSLARTDPYLTLASFLNAIIIKAGFLLKKISKLSFILFIY